MYSGSEYDHKQPIEGPFLKWQYCGRFLCESGSKQINLYHSQNGQPPAPYHNSFHDEKLCVRNFWRYFADHVIIVRKTKAKKPVVGSWNVKFPCGWQWLTGLWRRELHTKLPPSPPPIPSHAHFSTAFRIQTGEQRDRSECLILTVFLQ